MNNKETTMTSASKTWLDRAHATAGRAMTLATEDVAEARSKLADETKPLEWGPSILEDGIKAEHLLACWKAWVAAIEGTEGMGTPEERTIRATRRMHDWALDQLTRDTEYARLKDHAQRKAQQEFYRSMVQILEIAGGEVARG